MIPVVLWFSWPCGSELAVRGFLHALPRSGDVVSEDSEVIYNWSVTSVSHNIVHPDREVWIELELADAKPWEKRDRVRMRKQLEKAGWTMVSEFPNKRQGK